MAQEKTPLNGGRGWMKEVNEEINCSETNSAVSEEGTAHFVTGIGMVGVVASFLARCYTLAEFHKRLRHRPRQVRRRLQGLTLNYSARCASASVPSHQTNETRLGTPMKSEGYVK
jgi:hypothetical protein